MSPRAPTAAGDRRDEVRQRLQRAVAHLRMALEVAGMVTWVWDLLDDRVYYSDNLPRIVRGRKTQSFTRIAQLLPTIHPDDRPKLARALARTKAQGVPFDCEYRVLMLDGHYRWIHGKGKTVIREGGEAVRVLGVSQDITARKLAEQELQKHSRQLSELATELVLVEHRQRRHIAETIHENLQQILVAAGLEAETLTAAADPRIRARGRRLRHALTEALAVSRGMILELAPPVSMRQHLPVAFEWLVRYMRQHHHLTVDLCLLQVPRRVPETLGILLFTSARELLLNVVKHAGVKRAALILRRDRQTITLEVADNGRGLQRESPTSVGFGLFSIRERAELLGGRFDLGGIRGGGTRATLRLPLQFPVRK